MIRMLLSCLVCCTSFTCPAAETLQPVGTVISKIYLDSKKDIHIVYSDGKEVRPPKEEGQISCESFAVAEDKQTAGWLVDDYQTGSYAIPTTLVIYRNGKVIQRVGNGFAFGRWYFLGGGSQVALSTNTVHGDVAPNYELRDIKSNKVIDHWQGQLNEKSPEWARGLSRPN